MNAPSPEKRTKRTSILVRPSVLARVDQLAELEGRSRSDVVDRLLTVALSAIAAAGALEGRRGA